jgi:hypothetical protein
VRIVGCVFSGFGAGTKAKLQLRKAEILINLADAWKWEGMDKLSCTKFMLNVLCLGICNEYLVSAEV